MLSNNVWDKTGFLQDTHRKRVFRSAFDGQILHRTIGSLMSAAGTSEPLHSVFVQCKKVAKNQNKKFQKFYKI